MKCVSGKPLWVVDIQEQSTVKEAGHLASHRGLTESVKQAWPENMGEGCEETTLLWYGENHICRPQDWQKYWWPWLRNGRAKTTVKGVVCLFLVSVTNHRLGGASKCEGLLSGDMYVIWLWLFLFFSGHDGERGPQPLSSHLPPKPASSVSLSGHPECMSYLTWRLE